MKKISYNMKKSYIFITLLIVIVLILEVLNIYFSNKVAVDSLHATKLRETIKILDEENSSLRSQILASSSYEVIASRATELGFTTPKRFISLFAPAKLSMNSQR